MIYMQDRKRATGRTTSLQLSAISQALINPCQRVEFIDHIPHTVCTAKHHSAAIKYRIELLQLSDIKVWTEGAAVFLVNNYDPWPRWPAEEAWKKLEGSYPTEDDYCNYSSFYYFCMGFSADKDKNDGT